MDGWISGWMGGWMDGWMDGWMGGWMDKWVDGLLDGWMDGWVDGQMGGWVSRWMDTSDWVSSSLQMQPEPRLGFCTGISCSRGGINAGGRNLASVISPAGRGHPTSGLYLGSMRTQSQSEGSAPTQRCPCPLRPRPVGALQG